MDPVIEDYKEVGSESWGSITLLKDSWESPPVDILLRSLLDIDVNGSYFIDRCGGYSGFLLFDYGSLWLLHWNDVE